VSGHEGLSDADSDDPCHDPFDVPLPCVDEPSVMPDSSLEDEEREVQHRDFPATDSLPPAAPAPAPTPCHSLPTRSTRSARSPLSTLSRPFCVLQLIPFAELLLPPPLSPSDAPPLRRDEIACGADWNNWLMWSIRARSEVLFSCALSTEEAELDLSQSDLKLSMLASVAVDELSILHISFMSSSSSSSPLDPGAADGLFAC
jgi:hypothetical protein